MHHAMALPMRRAVLIVGRLGVVTVPPAEQRRGGLHIVYNFPGYSNEGDHAVPSHGRLVRTGRWCRSFALILPRPRSTIMTGRCTGQFVILLALAACASPQ